MKFSQCFFKIAILTLVMAMLSVPSPANGEQDKPKDQESSVVKGLRLSTELVGSELLKPQGIITVKLKLENTGKSRVYIHKELGFGIGGIRVAIVDANNNRVAPNLIAESFPTPVRNEEDLQAIEPGKCIDEQINIHLIDYEIAPGDYTLRILYISPVAANLVPKGLTALTSADKTLEAKPIKFKVLVP